jgi:hypothetical protein
MAEMKRPLDAEPWNELAYLCFGRFWRPGTDINSAIVTFLAGPEAHAKEEAITLRSCKASCQLKIELTDQLTSIARQVVTMGSLLRAQLCSITQHLPNAEDS